MEKTIVGTWISKDKDGKKFQEYEFRADGTYRMAWCDDSAKVYDGTYRLEDKMLTLYPSRDRASGIGYIGLSCDAFVEGFKRVSAGEGIEGEWLMDSVQCFARSFVPLAFDASYRISFKNGLMVVVETVYTNGHPGESRTFTGQYTVSGDTITISGNETGGPAYFTDGKKAVKIIDDVLTLLDDVTCTSFFNRVE